MTFERGDIVMLPFPFSDLTRAKNRPVLVLSPPDVYGDFIGLAKTSRSHHTNLVAVTPLDYVTAPLPEDTWIRADKVFSFNDSLVVKVVSRVKEALIEQTLDILCHTVGKP